MPHVPPEMPVITPRPFIFELITKDTVVMENYIKALPGVWYVTYGSQGLNITVHADQWDDTETRLCELLNRLGWPKLLNRINEVWPRYLHLHQDEEHPLFFNWVTDMNPGGKEVEIKLEISPIPFSHKSAVRDKRDMEREIKWFMASYFKNPNDARIDTIIKLAEKHKSENHILNIRKDEGTSSPELPTSPRIAIVDGERYEIREWGEGPDYMSDIQGIQCTLFPVKDGL